MYVQKRYLRDPTELLALPESDAKRLGLMGQGTHASFMLLAQRLGVPNPKLIITIARKNGMPSTVTVTGEEAFNVTFDPGDQCYPIVASEWDQFLKDEPVYCRAPCQVWAVDGSKYTAPI